MKTQVTQLGFKLQLIHFSSITAADPGWEKIRIRDKQPRSAQLQKFSVVYMIKEKQLLLIAYGTGIQIQGVQKCRSKADPDPDAKPCLFV